MKIGFVSMPLSGHLNPMTALARKLQSRGHEVVFIGVPDAEPIVRAANLNFVAFCETEYPVGSTDAGWGRVAKLHGEEVVRHTSKELLPGLCKTALERLPEKLIETGVEAVVFDTIYFFLELAPMRLGMPYVHIWNILHLDLSGSTPACFFSWPHDATPEGRARNIEGLKMAQELLAPIVAIAASYAEKNGLQIDWSDPAATVSKLAVISQTPKEFDFPDSSWPASFHYAGPFHDDGGREQVPFPWEKLTGKPLVYASMGTLVNGLDQVYKTILEAVSSLQELQVVLSIGNNVNPDNLGPIPSNTIVVRKAPQIELLKRAALCITHAGLNTALEALAQGVPMVAIPIGYDQPGVAARIAHHGAGEFIEVEDLTVEGLSELIQKVQKTPSYRNRARYFKKVIAQTHGLDVAANVIERAFGTNQTADVAAERAELSRV
ncbi:MAG TPA: glycosyltransferase [Bryobacteraceae bacterium]|nr:glycosyltransferase [Bryobacteraceae bacterium]